MPKFSSKQHQPNRRGVVATTDVRARTYEGHLGFERDAKSELFLLAVTNMVSEDTFYESGRDRDDRFKQLCWAVATTEPEWLARFIPYLRNTMQMRSAALVAAAHYVAAGAPGGRQVVDKMLTRSDEPAEILAFYAQEYGRQFPQPLKRGVADACQRLYTEQNALKYDGQSKAWRMGDVLALVHPKPLGAEQSALWRWLLDTRHNREEIVLPEGNPMVWARSTLERIPVENRRAVLHGAEIERELASAGMTWESLSGWLQGPMDAEAWEAVIPSMGYMALLRNLRNFEQAGVSSFMLDYVSAKLTSPDEVARSRQFPFRFLSAYKSLESERFSYAIEQALDLSVQNIPHFGGKTLILIDQSGSMDATLSGRSTLRRSEAAALFGFALAKRCADADTIIYGSAAYLVEPTGSVLRLTEKYGLGNLGGTNTWGTASGAFADHDRIVVLTDEQAHPGYVPEFGVPCYTFNLAGYHVAHAPSGEKGFYTFGGLTDAGFRMLSMLDQTGRDSWPFMADA